MLPVEQWDSVIGSLHGVIFHGVERIKSAQVLAALGCSANKEQEGKLASRADAPDETYMVSTSLRPGTHGQF